jgi:hypothetical protein
MGQTGWVSCTVKIAATGEYTIECNIVAGFT